MGKLSPTITLDSMLDFIALSTRMTVCSTQPTTYNEAITTYRLAEVAMVTGSFAKAAGDVSGRKVTMAAQNAVPILFGGTAEHVALVRVADTTFRYCTTCTPQVLTSGGTVDIPAWKIEAVAAT